MVFWYQVMGQLSKQCLATSFPFALVQIISRYTLPSHPDRKGWQNESRIIFPIFLFLRQQKDTAEGCFVLPATPATRGEWDEEKEWTTELACLSLHLTHAPWLPGRAAHTDYGNRATAPQKRAELMPWLRRQSPVQAEGWRGGGAGPLLSHSHQL